MALDLARQSCSKLYDAMSGCLAYLHVLVQRCDHPCLSEFAEGKKLDPLDRITLPDAFTYMRKAYVNKNSLQPYC